jgi:hypothetical protein
MVIRIPQPAAREKAALTDQAALTNQAAVKVEEGKKPSKGPGFWQDAVFGWNYLKEQKGLFALLWFYAPVNFFLNFSMVLLGPMVLSQYSAREYGVV